jgi:hypothetical protein
MFHEANSFSNSNSFDDDGATATYPLLLQAPDRRINGWRVSGLD